MDVPWLITVNFLATNIKFIDQALSFLINKTGNAIMDLATSAKIVKVL